MNLKEAGEIFNMRRNRILSISVFFVMAIACSFAQRVNTAGQTFERKVVVEEFTGSWCGNCPRGTVGLSRLAEDFGDRVICIAVHVGSGEPMLISAYADLQPGSGVPACIVNRGDKLDPYSGSGSRGFNHYGLDVDVEEQLNMPAEAGVTLVAEWADAQQWDVKFTATTTFSLSADEANYRLAFVLLEDGLTGLGRSWEQVNYYSYEFDSSLNTQYADDDMKFWRESPKYVTEMEYNHVPVNTLGIKSGIPSSIKAPIVSGQPQVYSDLVTTLNQKVIQDKERLTAVALLLDTTTGRIVNADNTEILPYGTNAISSTETTDNKDNKPRYNIGGQRINTPLGNNIVIENGKKIVAKN